MTDRPVRVRFAPSPTGYFHVGGARTALYNWLFARQHGGKFVLRIEDTDRTRYVPDALADLLDGLRWLGLCWDEGPEVGGPYGPYYQSDRLERYRAAAEALIAKGEAYRCYCSPERLAKLREAQRASKQHEGYDRHCRHLTRKQIADYEAEGIRPVVRLAAPLEGETTFHDMLRGPITVDNRQLNDLILLKSDGFPTYSLGVVVDDHDMQISHIMRGEEWISTAPALQCIYDAFGWESPIQAHLPTILDPSGEGKLSKRKKRLPDGREALTFVHEFKQAGYLPEAMVNFLALVGWSYDGQTEFFRRDELIELFDLSRVSTSSGAFSYDKLDHMNATYIRELGTNDLAGRLLQVLRQEGFPADLEFALKAVPLVRERIKTLAEVVPWVDYAFADRLDYEPNLLIPKKMDAESTMMALHAAADSLRSVHPFEEAGIEEALRGLADRLDLKLGQLLGPIRVACTGKQVTPPLFGTLDLIGQQKVIRRLEDAIALLAG
ncbi:MAG: glutamate--tRNA ligase [Anaerolineae bacterium]